MVDTIFSLSVALITDVRLAIDAMDDFTIPPCEVVWLLLEYACVVLAIVVGDHPPDNCMIIMECPVKVFPPLMPISSTHSGLMIQFVAIVTFQTRTMLLQ